MATNRQRQEIKATIRKCGQIIYSVFNDNSAQGFLYTIGNTALGSSELYIACHKTLVFPLHHVLNVLHCHIKNGKRVLDGQLIHAQDGRVFKARQVTDPVELAYFNAKLVCQAEQYYGKPVRVIELVSFGHAPGADCRVADVMNKQRFCALCGTSKGKDGADLLKCGQCKLVYYCSKDCQTADWPRHKVGCQAIARGCGCSKGKCAHAKKDKAKSGKAMIGSTV